MSNPNTRKSCVVPKCKSTTVNAPEKLFFLVPKDVEMRNKWIEAMKRLDPFGAKSNVFCCEDHFDIQNDMENYIKYKLVGGRIKLKKGTIPHKFKCQEENTDTPGRPAVQKRKQMKLLGKPGEPIPMTLDAPVNPEVAFVACCEDDSVIEMGDTGIEDSKHDVVYQLLCMGCLCGGRTTNTLTDPALMMYFKDILSGVQGSLSVSVATPRLCWECEALLKKAFHFTKQVRECFMILQPTLQMLGTEGLSACLLGEVRREPRLQSCRGSTVHIPTDGLAPSDSERLAPSDTPMEEGYCHEEPLLTAIKEEFDDKDLLASGIKEEVPNGTGESTAEIENETLNKQTYKFQVPVATTSKLKGTSDIDNNSAEKRFHCVVCSKGFFYNSDLKSHLRSHTGEKPYKCTMCKKRFNQNGRLTIHMRTHTGEKLMCTVCQKGFNQTSDLKLHMRTHTCEKHYQCVVCGKLYTTRGNVIHHTKSHIGEG